MTRRLLAFAAALTLSACAHHPASAEGAPGLTDDPVRSGPQSADLPAAPLAALAPAPPVVASLPGGPVTEDPDDGRVGVRSAPMAVLEFSDLECPFCGPAYGALSAYVKTHDDVRLVHKHYPISGLCNPNVEGPRHEHACAAARAVICANEQGRFDALAALLFANQGTLADADIEAFARQAGVYNLAYTACLAKPETAGIIARDVAEAEVAKVGGTPTIYVWGVWGPRWIQVHGGASAAILVLDAARAHQPLPGLTPAE